MSLRNYSVLASVAIWLASACCLTGCFNPRKTPLFKKLGEDWAQRNAKYTEEALKESTVLQEIDRLCTQELPLFGGFQLVRRSTSESDNPYLSYDYRSDAELPRVKEFYLSFFARANWRVVENREGGWGPRWHAVFRKDRYKIAATYVGPGDEANYSFFCEKIIVPGGGE